MRFFVVHAFAEMEGEGNKAGVVLLNQKELLKRWRMQEIAKAAGFSETAFVSKLSEDDFKIRFFTPTEEIPLCGHASIASAVVLKNEGWLTKDRCIFHASEENVEIFTEDPVVWLKIAEPTVKKELSEDTIIRLCEAYGLDRQDIPEDLLPAIVDVGISDIQLPVKSRAALLGAEQNRQKVIEITKELDVVGVHMFCVSEQDERIFCSNYAPRYGIDEECATGTANAGLTYYLYKRNRIILNKMNHILQGEHMDCPSKIYSKVIQEQTGTAILIGGTAVVSQDDITESIL